MSEKTVDVIDVARFILDEAGPMSTMKLQKLCYYTQAWHLAWHHEPLIGGTFQAWTNGPVHYELFQAHKGKFTISSEILNKGDANNLSPEQKDHIGTIIEAYGQYTGTQLSLLAHEEHPWAYARNGYSSGQPSGQPISNDAMRDFYEALADSEDAVTLAPK